MFGRVVFAGKPFDPVQLSLTGYWRDYPSAGSNWSGTASLGSSGSNSLTQSNTVSRSTLNGHGTAGFSAASSQFFTGAVQSTYFGATAASGWCLTRNNIASTVRLFSSNAAGVFNGYGFNWVGASTNWSFIRGSGTGTVVNRSGSQNVWTLVTFRYDGVNLQVGANEAPGASGGGSTTAASGSTTLTDTHYVGQMGNSTTFYTGDIAELAYASTALGDTIFSQVKAYINNRYALSL